MSRSGGAVAAVQAEALDVGVGPGLDRLDHVGARRVLEEVRVAVLQLQVLGDRDLLADLRDADDLAVLGFEDGEDAGLLCEAGDLDRVGRGRAPAQRAGDEDVQVTGAPELHRPLDLVLEVAELGDGCGGDVGDLVRHRDQRRVLALAEDVARLGRRPAWCWRCARPAVWRLSAGHRCSCRPRCRSRRRARRRFARTSPRGSRSRYRACRRRRPDQSPARPRGPWRASRRRSRWRPPAHCRTVSGSRAGSRSSRGTGWRRPPGSPWRWPLRAFPSSPASPSRARTGRQAPRRIPGRPGGRR